MTVERDASTPMAELDPDDGIPTPSAAFAFVLVFFGVFGIVALVAAVFVGTGGDSTTSVSAAKPVAVTLSEFAITPGTVAAVNGAGIDVTNGGNVQHNLAIEGTSAATAMMDPGQSAHLDTTSLQPGDYTLICQVPGHKD